MTSQPTSAPPTRRRRLPAVLLVLLATAGTLVWVSGPNPVRAAESGSAGRFPEVGTLPLYGLPTAPSRLGWLILNPVSRRGYQIYEGFSGGRARTTVQSFDLDSLKPLRRAELAGAPITGGPADTGNVNSLNYAGDVVHAVDPEGHRIYLALSQPQSLDQEPAKQLTLFSPPDAQRPLTRFVAIDEDVFDRCAGQAGCPFAASFREPADQARLHNYWVVGMKVTRRHTAPGGKGRLLTLFAQPQPGGAVNGVTVYAVPFYDHTLAQWAAPDRALFGADDALATEDATGLTTTTGQSPPATDPLPPGSGSAVRMEPCRNASLASAEAFGTGNYQWGLLALKDAVWTACQAADRAGAVVRVPLEADGDLDLLGTQDLFRLSQKISDVLVDDGGGRLLVRSWGSGHTWWTFDTGLRRFRGAIAAKGTDSLGLAAGVDPTTGRLYQLMEDYIVTAGAGTVPVRGGFSFSDTRLDPAPPLENAKPDMAYPAAFAIRVDPVTRRVFVRRGHLFNSLRYVYPGTEAATEAPAEPYYRVLLDNVPITEAPAAADDSAFTTGTAEDPAATRASYLGSGSGYGSRTLLVGGLNKATSPVPTGPCGSDDRELVSGAVRSVEVSDLSTAADAASLDADGKTQEQLGTPVQRCGSEAVPTTIHTEELAFDQVDPKTKKRDGVNRYRATCTDDDEGSATAPTDKAVSRHRFSAEAKCDHSHGKASGEATGAFSAAQLDAVQDRVSGSASQVPEEPVTVGHAHSEVKVTRQVGKGITVTVDSLAREIVIPGVGTVGAVRATAVSTSTGRRGGADADFDRTVCGVHFGDLNLADCFDESEQDELEDMMNQRLAGRGRVRFRDPDPTLFAGSASGYKAGVQRPALDLFEDSKIARDTSLAVPGLELVLYNGDGGGGTGRQFFQFAGVQAGTSYGIACLYGQRPDGSCAKADDVDADTITLGGGGDDGDLGGTETITVTEPGETVYAAGPAATERPSRRPGLLERIVRAPFEAAADVLRLLFANPAEFGLMAAVWALLYAPCYLGERRRSIRNLRARRAALGGA